MPLVTPVSQSPMPNDFDQNPNIQSISCSSQNTQENLERKESVPKLISKSQRPLDSRQRLQELDSQENKQQAQSSQKLKHKQVLRELSEDKCQQKKICHSSLPSHIKQEEEQLNLLQSTQLQCHPQFVMEKSSVIQPSAMKSSPFSGIIPNNQSCIQQSTQSVLGLHRQPVLRKQQQPQKASFTFQQQKTMLQCPLLPSQQQHQQLRVQHPKPTNIVSKKQNISPNRKQAQQMMLRQQNSISNLPQQRQLAPNQQVNLSHVYQKHFGQQSNVAVLGQRHTLVGTGSGNYTQQSNKRQAQQKTQQTVSDTLPFQEQQSQQQPPLQQLVSQSQSQQDIHPRVEISVVGSSSKMGLEIVPDWQQNAYQKIQCMKEKYLLALTEIYQSLVDRRQQHISLPGHVKTDSYHMLENWILLFKDYIKLLHVPKRNISPAFEERLDEYEKQIRNIINSINLRKLVASPKQRHQLPICSMHASCQSFLPQSQSPQVLPHSGQENPQLQLQNLETSVRTMKQNSMTSIQHGSVGEHTTAARTPDACFVISTPGMPASPLLEPYDLDGNLIDVTTLIVGKSADTEQPLERLINLVKSMSQKALSASVDDIGSVMTLFDKIAGSAPGSGSITAVGEDLAAMTNSHLQAWNMKNQGGPTGTRRKRRYVSAMPMEMLSFGVTPDHSSASYTDSENFGLNSTLTSRANKSRIESQGEV